LTCYLEPEEVEEENRFKLNIYLKEKKTKKNEAKKQIFFLKNIIEKIF